MNKKVLKSAPAVLLATTLAAVIAIRPNIKDWEGKIDCVHEAIVGELVVIEAEEADAYDWSSIPHITNWYKTNNNRTVIFSGMEEGEYIFLCAMTKDGQVKLVVHKLVVRKQIVRPLSEKLIRSWLPDNYDIDLAAKLAVSFESAATSRVESVKELITLTAVNNKVVLGSELDTWMPFLQKLSEHCKNTMQEKSLDEHKALWLEISRVLKLK